MENYDVVAGLNELISQEKVGFDSLSAITGLTASEVQNFAKASSSLNSVASSTNHGALKHGLLGRLVVLLRDGLEIDDEARVRAQLEVLEGTFLLSKQNIGNLLGLEPSQIASFVSDPTSVSAEMRYSIGVGVGAVAMAVFQIHQTLQELT